MGKEFLSIRISEEQAAKTALDLYGLMGSIASLPGELDFNFRLKAENASYLLKISRPEYDVEQMMYQTRLLEHLAASREGVVSPIPIPDQQGRFVGEMVDEAGINRKVRLLTWIEGRLWSVANPISDRLLLSLGTKAGKLTKMLQDFDHPRANRIFDWDLAQAEWTCGFLHLFSKDRKALVAFFQGKYLAFQKEYRYLRKSIVHNDVNDNNVIVSADLINPEVEALIDFGDAVHTQIINDLAITIAYAVMGKPDPLRAALPVVEGYHSQFPIQEKELEYLYTLVAMRLVISLTKSAIN